MDDVLDIHVPHIGEGIRTVKLVRVLKQAGEYVEEDEGIAEIETDKATLEIPAPRSGIIAHLRHLVGDTVDVGDVLMGIGLSDQKEPAVLQRTKLSPASQVDVKAASDSLPALQLELIKQFERSAQIIIPASISQHFDWSDVDAIRAGHRKIDPRTTPSRLDVYLYGLALAMQDFPKLRSKLTETLTLETHANSIIGLSRENDDDTIKIDTITLSPHSKPKDVTAIRRRTQAALARPVLYHSVTVSDMSSLGVISANPTLVYPAAAIVVIGAPHSADRDTGVRLSTIILGFDHRLINGAYAARFLKRIGVHIRHLRASINSISSEH